MTAVEQPVVVSPGGTDQEVRWLDVCDADRVRPDRGVAVLVGGDPVAVFRLSAFDGGLEEWRAVSHLDPLTGAPVMARGLVGTVGEAPLIVPTVASPLHKERYNLRSGRCLDHPTTALQVFAVRVHNGRVEVGAPVTPA